MDIKNDFSGEFWRLSVMCYHLHSDVLFMKKLIDITKEKGDFEKKLVAVDENNENISDCWQL